MGFLNDHVDEIIGTLFEDAEDPEAMADMVSDALARRGPRVKALTVDGRPVIRVVIDVTIDPDTDTDEREYLGELLAERMGDNLDAVLGVNDRMADAGMTRWHVRAEPAEED